MNLEAKELRRKADYEIERFIPKAVMSLILIVFLLWTVHGIGMILGRYKQSGIIARSERWKLANLRPFGEEKIF